MDINTRLRNHIDTLFGGVAQSVRVQEIKEEMLRNLTEKYYDLITCLLYTSPSPRDRG